MSEKSEPFIVTIDNKEIELKFTFNSFMYMEDLDLSDVENIAKNPFKVVNILQSLFYGAVNNSKKIYISKDTTIDWLDAYFETGSTKELLEKLLNLLTESSFFVSLQKE